MAKIGRSARERLERRLAGCTMRMYVRISRVGDRKSALDAQAGDPLLWSDEDQLSAGERCCEEWEMSFDAEESRLHSDPDVSGYHSKWIKRKGLAAHYRDAQNGEFQVLGFHFADRIGRNVRETIEAIDSFLALGIVIYIAEDDEFMTADDKEAINRLHSQMVLAERYSIKLSARVQSAHRRRALSGRYTGGPSCVWLKWSSSSRRYEVVEEMAEAMRLLVDLRLQGLTECAITLRLNQAFRKPNGKLWRQSKVNRYLTLKFIEKMEGHAHFCVEGEEPILIPNQWDPIITPEKAVALKLALESVGKRNYRQEDKDSRVKATRASEASARFLLSGRIWCSECGCAMVPARGSPERRNRYGCCRVMTTMVKHSWAQAYFVSSLTEDAVLNALAVWLKEPPAALPTESAPVEMPLKRQIDRLTSQIDELIDFYQTGVWSKEDYLRKHEELCIRRDELRRRQLETGRPAAIQLAHQLSSDLTDRVALRQLVHLLVERIELPIYQEGHVRGNGKPIPHVRLILRYPMTDGAKSLLSPLRYKGDIGKLEVIGE